MFLSARYSNKRALVVLGLGALALVASGCSLLIGMITTEPPKFPPEILNVKLVSKHIAYGLTKIEISIDFQDLDGDIREDDALVNYEVEQVWNTGDYCWILESPRAPLAHKSIQGRVKPEKVTLDSSGTRGTAIIGVVVGVWPESAFCTAGVTVSLIDKAGNESNSSGRQTIRLFEGYP